MRLLRFPLTVLGAMAMACAAAQTPYPDLTIQDVAWDEGEHHYAVTQKILSPSTPDLPASITGTADAEFVSGTEVRLLPGFHAGALNGAGRFHAYIDNSLSAPGDVVIISPAPDGSEPYGGIVDNVVHVHKWEKVEVGLRLPQEYQDAIDRFFDHYYSDPGDSFEATPSNVDAPHDLNPYADDSLRLLIALSKPDGSQTLKWGYFMREGKWSATNATAILKEDLTNVLHPYNIRFRFTPDQEGPWLFSLLIQAPFTSSLTDIALPNLEYSGYAFVSDPPMADNHGHLQVNENNRRTLKFEDDTPFFGLGTNMADKRWPHAWNDTLGPRLLRRDFDQMWETMDELHSVGGNFLRMWLIRGLFAPEWVNLGVYDAYHAAYSCFPNDPNTVPQVHGNGQFQCWAFDQMLDHARENNIYLQLCIDPYPPIVAYDAPHWVMHPFLRFLKPFRDNTPGANPYDLKRFFYSCEGDIDPDDTQAVRLLDGGAFYFWKRRYKYIMNRWGYSVNVPIIEPFNEVDQMLTYRYSDLRPNALGESPLCPDDRLEWHADDKLPPTYNDWLTDIIDYVRGPVDQEHPVSSPLGETHKLFLTGTGLDGTTHEDYYQPHHNPRVDLADVHIGFYPALQNERTMIDWRNHEGWKHAQDCMANFSEKPFNQGEYTQFSFIKIPNPIPGQPALIDRNDVDGFFHNYDVSFHNEIWTSAFSGRFVAGSSWSWARVFWWENTLPTAPADNSNVEQIGPFTNQLPIPGQPNTGINYLDLGLGIPVPITNRKLHQNFRPLADLLFRPSVQDLGFFDGNFTAEKIFDENPNNPNPIECYYLKNTENNTAIGWIHNRNASVAKSFYVKRDNLFQNFLGCTAPALSSIELPDFASGNEYYITWFPTRMNIDPTDLPSDAADVDMNSSVLLDFSSRPFGGVFNNYLDTLHSDYAFVITPVPFVKSLHLPAVQDVPARTDWDFSVYPNPARESFVLQFSDESIKDVTLLDVSGRRVAQYPNVVGPSLQVRTDHFAMGVYWVHVATEMNSKIKKLIIH